MCLDYLPIQASSVPCERAFSSSAETDTKRRNRISPDLFEALQVVKFHIKKKRLNFMEPWTATVEELEGHSIALQDHEDVGKREEQLWSSNNVDAQALAALNDAMAT